MTAPLLPPEIADAFRVVMNHITDELAEILTLAHTCSPELAAQLRRRTRGEVGALLDIMLAAPPCSLCPPTGGCSAHTCRAG